MIGMLVRSRAGHDKDKVYVVQGENQREVFLIDGLIRTMERPKKKKKKHIQVIHYYIEEEIKCRLENKQIVRDEEIKRQIKLYNGGIACQKQM